jgi:hypothetical protein
LTWCGGEPPIFHSSCSQLKPGYLELPPCNSVQSFTFFGRSTISPRPFPPNLRSALNFRRAVPMRLCAWLIH